MGVILSWLSLFLAHYPSIPELSRHMWSSFRALWTFADSCYANIVKHGTVSSAVTCVCLSVRRHGIVSSVCVWDVTALCRLSLSVRRHGIVLSVCVCGRSYTDMSHSTWSCHVPRVRKRRTRSATDTRTFYHVSSSVCLSVCLSSFSPFPYVCCMLCLCWFITISVLRCNFSISVRRHFPYSIARSYFFSCRHQRLSTCHVFL